MSEANGAHDWLDGVALVLGRAFLVLPVRCVWGIFTAIAKVGDAEAPPGSPSRSGSTR